MIELLRVFSSAEKLYVYRCNLARALESKRGEALLVIDSLEDAKNAVASITGYEEVCFDPGSNFTGEVVQYFLANRGAKTPSNPLRGPATVQAFKYSKVAKEKTIADWQLLTEHPNFCTGKSTAAALQLIANALAHPEQEFKIQDLSVPSQLNRPAYTNYFRGSVADLVAGLGLEYITFNTARNVICYNPYGIVLKRTLSDGSVAWVDKG